MARFVDLSHVIEAGMPAYPGLPEPRFGTFLTHAESLERRAYAEGTSFQIATYDIGGNTGTYLDAPFHRHAELADLAELELARIADVPGMIVSIDELHGADVSGRAVLVRTDWSKKWGQDDYFTSGPFLSRDHCERLVKQGAALVGIDCANIDDMGDRSRPAHTVLLGAGIPIVEHLCRLDELPTSGFRFFAVPPAIVGGTSFPVRAFALID
jgi:kynurenine formamidase